MENDRNYHIMADAWGFWGPKSFSFWDILIFLNKTAENPISMQKISFWRFSQKVSHLEYVLFHKININMAIANITGKHF
jgi:hypothetical protein